MGIVTSSIAAKFAFFPPTPPSYRVVKDDVTGKLRLQDSARNSWINSPANVEVLLLKTSKNEEIAAMFVRNPQARLTLLYSHGNAADLGQMHDLYVELSNMLRVNLLGYDYTGYGASTGKPREYSTYADIRAAFDCLQTQFHVRPEDTILYGQSVGSGPTVDLASKIPRLRGVVLHSPIMSGVRVLYEVKATYWFDIFPNIDKLPKVECPVFVLHGTADEVVDISHGRTLAEVCRRPFNPLFIENAHHCDLEFYPEYLRQLRKFVAYVDSHPPEEEKEDGAEKRPRRRSGWTSPAHGLRRMMTSPARTPSWARGGGKTPRFTFSPSRLIQSKRPSTRGVGKEEARASDSDQAGGRAAAPNSTPEASQRRGEDLAGVSASAKPSDPEAEIPSVQTT